MSTFRIRGLDHVNVRTANLERMTKFYTEVLGLQTGPRPEFSFPGAWLYCGDDPVLHLVGVDTPPRPEELRIEHFAFAASGLREFVERLESRELDYRRSDIPGTSIVQVHLRDCDGNHVHVDFERSD